MINKTDAYKQAIVADERRTYVNAVLEIADPDIVYGETTSSGENIYSKSSQIHDKVFRNDVKYATLEKGRWHLDASYKILPDDAEEVTNEIGYVSSTMTDEDGEFDIPQFAQLNFSGVSILQAFSVVFSINPDDGVPADFTVEVRQGNNVYFTQTVTDNSDTKMSFDGFTVYNPTAIRITVTKMTLAHRRLRVVEIFPGIYENWDENIISDISIKQQINFACTALPYSSCNLTMHNRDRRFEPRNKNGVFKSIEERQPITVSFGVLLKDETVDYTPAGVYYQSDNGWKTGTNELTMTWQLVDIIGLLAARSYVVPSTLPTTLEGWAADLVAQLGVNFTDRYTVDDNYKNTYLTAEKSDLTGRKCGDILRYLCMAAGCFPRADVETGYLAIEPLWRQGNYITLDNIENYPVIKANNDIALISFTIADNDKTVYNIGGTNPAASQTVSVNNPFINTQAKALSVSRNILAAYGGNTLEIVGRGDFSSECGDVSSVQLDESTATSARLISQTFSFSNGVVKSLPSTLLQADGVLLFNTQVVLTTSQTWTAPSGVTQLFVSLIGGGSGGENGTDGSWTADGKDGIDGVGGRVWYSTINIESGQSFEVTIGAGGTAGGGVGGNTVFGAYSSFNGEFINGYTDVRSGAVYARSGVILPVNGSGDGGKGGVGGERGRTHEEYYFYENQGDRIFYHETITVVDNEPTEGQPGTAGASGAVVIWYATPGV